jgi:hypothetical protein
MFSSSLYNTLYKAVGVKRPHKAQSTDAFCAWLCKKLPKHHMRDDFGNIHLDLRVLPDHTSARTLFVAHVDTVHREGGKNKYQRVGNQLQAQDDPLGADDGAGVAMLMHLIQFATPGYYLFTQGEERGGLGAKYITKHYAALLSSFDRAIAFDRRGIDSIITYQGGSRCCSDAFAEALGDYLNSGMSGFYSPDSSGVYTDTAEFVDYIPECTNISVGYNQEHSDRETLDLDHFEALSQAVLMVPWETLPVKRDPSVHDSLWGPPKISYTPPVWAINSRDRRLTSMSREAMLDLAYTYPEAFVDLVRDELCIY